MRFCEGDPSLERGVPLALPSRETYADKTWYESMHGIYGSVSIPTFDVRANEIYPGKE